MIFMSRRPSISSTLVAPADAITTRFLGEDRPLFQIRVVDRPANESALKTMLA